MQWGAEKNGTRKASKSLAEREIKYRFFVEKKEIDIQASVPAPYSIQYRIEDMNIYDENGNLIQTFFANLLKISPSRTMFS